MSTCEKLGSRTLLRYNTKKTGFKIQGVFKTHDSVFNERSAQAEIHISPNAVPDFQIFIEIKYLMPIQ